MFNCIFKCIAHFETAKFIRLSFDIFGFQPGLKFASAFKAEQVDYSLQIYRLSVLGISIYSELKQWWSKTVSWKMLKRSVQLSVSTEILWGFATTAFALHMVIWLVRLLWLYLYGREWNKWNGLAEAVWELFKVTWYKDSQEKPNFL